MHRIVRLRLNFASAVALGAVGAFAGLGSAPALAVTPSPPPGAPGPQPSEHPRAGRREPHPRVPHRRRVRHLPERRAGQLRRAAERLGRPEHDGANGVRPADDGALPADRRSVGAPQRVLGRRRSARARMVRHASPVTTSDTLVWSPSGAPCGRPIDQWSMGGISVPAATAGLLAPCVSDDQLAQAGPWRISHTSTPLAHAETIAGPVTATVYASSTTAQTELVAELEDVTPSGASYPLTEGGAASPAGWRCLHDRALSDGSVVAHGRDAQVASSEPGSAGTSTAYCSSRSSGTRSSARSWVAARTTKAATPSSCARSHAWVVTHQRSPG